MFELSVRCIQFDAFSSMHSDAVRSICATIVVGTQMLIFEALRWKGSLVAFDLEVLVCSSCSSPKAALRGQLSKGSSPKAALRWQLSNGNSPMASTTARQIRMVASRMVASRALGLRQVLLAMPSVPSVPSAYRHVQSRFKANVHPLATSRM